MKFTSKQYAQALYEAVSETAVKDHDIVLDKFVKVLAQNGDLGKYEEIEKEYHLLEGKAKGIHQAEVIVARETEINASIIKDLNSIMGQKLDIKTKVDAGLVGGLILKVDETLIDASVKTQLNNLNSSLKM